MKMQDAMKVIKDYNKTKNEPPGFMVSFEKKENSMLRSDHFPDKHADEPLIESVEEAWNLAKRFGEATSDDFVNIYVIDQTFSPVSGYNKRMIKRYQ